MTNAEFQKHLQDIYNSHDILGKSERKTVNELLYMLRMDSSVTDYNVILMSDDGRTLCIPSVKECFVPVHDLTLYVKEVEYEEDDYFDGICLTVHTEDKWFGKVRWCIEDLENALETQGYPVTENNVSKLYELCSKHWFEDHMIEIGWEYMYNHIGCGDGWDEYEK